MAYMSQERKRELAPGIMTVLAKHGYKGSLKVRHHSELVITVSEGPEDITPVTFQGIGDYVQVNQYHIDNLYGSNPNLAKFLKELAEAGNAGNHDNSDIMTDYFDVGWYLTINLGRYDKPYVHTPKKVK